MKIISGLVDKFRNNIDFYRSEKYNEAQLRADFLDPFFELLGWDITNKSAKSNYEREVLLEEPLKDDAESGTKKPDYTFRLFSERKFFLEAKKPFIKINDDCLSAKQIRRYGYTAKLKISVLSNFEYLALYDCSEKVDPDDKVEKCRIRIYHYLEYEGKFEEIKSLIGHESVYTGAFDKEWEHIEDKLKLHGVDKLFLKQLSEWRLSLGAEIFRIKPGIDEEELNDLVQGYLNSLIFLRVCEDRNIETYQTLLKFANENDFKALINKFANADKKFNSGLFSHEYKEEIIEKSSSVFWKIIRQLYYPESPYSFAVFGSDILGNIYEIFISKKLAIGNDVILLKDKPENIDRDVIATPVNIIQDILRETVLKICERKSDKFILNCKFADIACGSGAFLLELFRMLNDILIDYYIKNDRSKLIQTSVNTYKLPFGMKKVILDKCIFGFDKDFNAVQASRFGLVLKLLEEEDKDSISKKVPVLPDLSNNIVFGNSLISPLQIPPGKGIEAVINPYNFKAQKFDVIVGNPPYMSTEDMKNITPSELPIYKQNYFTAYKQFDKYYLFIEKAVSLLKKGGYLGYIVPSKFTKVGAAVKLRELLSEKQLTKSIISFGANQVFESKTTYTCLLIAQNSKQKQLKYLEVRSYKNWKVREYRADDYDTIDSSKLNSETWELVPGYLRSAYEKIISRSIYLSDLIGNENIYNGIQTSANSIYIHIPEKHDDKFIYFTYKGKKRKIEKAVTRPYFQTSSGCDSLNTYRPFHPNSFVIYPYKKVDGKTEFVYPKELKRKYPNAYKFLNEHKSILSNSKRDIKPAPETGNEWYRYGRHQSLEKCDVPSKIIVGVLSQGNKYAIDYYGTLISSGGTAGYCMITLPDNFPYSIYYMQALLNSKYIEWFSSIYGEVFRGGYIARGTKVLKQLPVRIINFEDPDEKEMHDRISDIQRSMIEKQGEIDLNIGKKRKLIILQRQFDELTEIQNGLLKNLFNLGILDDKIPLIKEMYGTD